MNRDFWRGRRVLLTGHTGFKGSWLSLWLQAAGTDLHGLALAPPTRPNLFTAARIGDGMRSTLCDIRNFDAVRQAVEHCRPEIVIHMAAQPLVRYSYRYPVETYATNVMGTVHVLEAVRLVGSARVVVNVTTDKCYENREWVWGYRENEPMGGFDPYSSSKGCAELATSAYRCSFLADAGIGLASARAGNVIGGGDWAEDRLIPDILRAFEQAQPATIRNPGSIRPWQHVLEPLLGYLQLAERLWDEPAHYAGGWNFGPRDDDARPVGWIVEHMVRRWGPEASWRHDDSPQPHEAAYLKLDISKARLQLGWAPRWSLEVALDHIVDWHKAYLGGGDLREKSLEQIKEFSQ